MSTWSFDDFTSSPNNKWSKFLELKQLNPAFKVDLFCIPKGYGGCPDKFVQSLPDWVEVCLHGEWHTGKECAEWTKERMFQLMDEYENKPRWAHIFKAPGWFTSIGVMEALRERNWILAYPYGHFYRNQPEPIKGIRVYYHNLPGIYNVHGHIVGCGNGIEQCWDEYVKWVKACKDFRFISEVIK